MAWTEATKERMKELAQKRRGVLLKDIEPDLLLALTDEVKVQGGGVNTPIPHTEKCKNTSFGPRGGRRVRRVCDHAKACYLVYASQKQHEALKEGLPHIMHTTNIYLRHTQQVQQVERVVFNSEDVLKVFTLVHVSKPTKYMREV